MANDLFDMWPQEYIDLAKEVQYHQIPGVNPQKDIYENVANIAAYCEVILDGIYSPEDFKKICSNLTEKLHKSRILILN